VQVPCLPAGRDSCSGHKKSSTNVGDFYILISAGSSPSVSRPACRQAGIPVLGAKNSKPRLRVIFLKSKKLITINFEQLIFF